MSQYLWAADLVHRSTIGGIAHVLSRQDRVGKIRRVHRVDAERSVSEDVRSPFVAMLKKASMSEKYPFGRMITVSMSRARMAASNRLFAETIANFSMPGRCSTDDTEGARCRRNGKID